MDIRYGVLRNPAFALPLFFGLILLLAYVWLCIGFESIYRSPIPLCVGLAAVAYGPWYALL